ncbi:MAG: geranylgeranyl reductase family protein, partial [Bacillota bacterium]|nr:geranylgeranyl reductase family protein [Bacillota bacterium]
GPGGRPGGRRAGVETLILEAEEFPRPKPCAGGLSAAALKELGEPLPPGVAGRACRAVRPRYGGLAVTVRREETLVEVVHRDRFDAYLLSLARQAGAEVRHGTRVTAAEPGSDGVTLRTDRGTWRARVVVGADGARSRVGLAVRPPFPRRDLGVCQVGELPLRPQEYETFFVDGLEVWYSNPEKGYGWIFPQEAGLNVGIGSVARYLPSPRRELSRFLALAGLPEPAAVKGAVLPLGGRNHPGQAARVLLAGDALGVADPFTGEGIRYALLSGRLAGECAAAALHRSPAHPDLSSYPARCWESFGADLRYARLFARLYLSLDQRLNRLVFRHPGLFSRVADIMQGKGTYRDLVGKLGSHLPGYWLRGLMNRQTREFSRTISERTLRPPG